MRTPAQVPHHAAPRWMDGPAPCFERGIPPRRRGVDDNGALGWLPLEAAAYSTRKPIGLGREGSRGRFGA